MRFTLFTGLLTLAMLAGGCNKVKVSDKMIQTLSEQEVVEQMGQQQAVIVDVRKPDDFAQGHIAGAINIYLPQIRANDPSLANAKQIIVHASGWTDPLASAAVKKMLNLGYTNVYEFSGGVEVWKSAGHSLVTSAAPTSGRPETAH